MSAASGNTSKAECVVWDRAGDVVCLTLALTARVLRSTYLAHQLGVYLRHPVDGLGSLYGHVRGEIARSGGPKGTCCMNICYYGVHDVCCEDAANEKSCCFDAMTVSIGQHISTAHVGFLSCNVLSGAKIDLHRHIDGQRLLECVRANHTCLWNVLPSGRDPGGATGGYCRVWRCFEGVLASLKVDEV